MIVSRKGFNPKQLEAIESPLGANVIISAGAGSGKTATLSTKVLKLVFEDKVDPASLLVLTFTDKAAHEMKEKIIKKFNQEGGDPLIAQKIQSAHIQTFDSFSLYLAKKYSSDLGLPDSISIADENILSVKRSALLDEIFSEYYEKRDSQFIETNRKFNFSKDGNTKNIILHLDDKLANLLPSEKKDYIEQYQNRFLSDESITSFFNQYLELLKQDFVSQMDEEIFLYLHGESDKDNLIALLGEEKDVDCYQHQSFDVEVLQTLYERMIALLSLSGEDFISALNQLVEEPFMNGTKTRKDFKDKEKENRLMKGFRAIVKGGEDSFGRKKKGLKETLLRYGSFATQKENLQSFQSDIRMIFDILLELDRRMMDYKKTTAAFDFADIAQFALSLLVDTKYEAIAEQIKQRFTYILVDEYQDTNDFQEMFLNRLSASPNATLFVVGDAKQSIYGFRNANCQLFLDRKEKYYRDRIPNEIVVEMNTNYRSVKKLLDDINSIFVRYMSKDHGGICFADEREQLNYDDKIADLYQADMLYPKGEYGINILTYGSFFPQAGDNVTDQEILTIISDILDKIQNHYQVIELKNGKPSPRDCTFKDFAILLRKKRNFAPYKKWFAQFGIPINNDMEEHLGDVDCILLLQSLTDLISALMGYTQENIPHLFASVARSYIYGKEEGYSDEYLYQILSDKTQKRLWEDPLMVKVKDFCKTNQDNSLGTIFLHLLNDFAIVKKLPRVGNITDTVSKIDSFYHMVLSQQSVGEGLKEFVTLFKNISKYNVPIASNSVVALEDAVELTTIHKSKGLEYPIVYLPNGDNYLSVGSNLNKPFCTFSRQYGVLLPNYRHGNIYDEEGILVDSFLTPLYQRTEGSIADETSEHVRLFYVALTRAKESIYLVGQPSKKPEDLFAMLDDTPHYPKLDERYLAKKQKEGVLSAEMIEELSTAQETCRQLFLRRPKTSSSSPAAVAAMELYDHVLLAQAKDRLLSDIEEIKKRIYGSLVLRVPSLDEKQSYALLLQWLGLPKLPYAALYEAHALILRRYGLNADPSSLTEFLIRMRKALYDSDYSFFGLDPEFKSKDDDDTKKAKILSVMMNAFLKVLLSSVDDFDGSLEKEDYSFNTRYISPETKMIPLTSDANSTLLQREFTVDETEISFKDKEERQRASKFSGDEDNIEVKQIGVMYHHYLELVDFRSKDTSFIQDPRQRAVIDRVLALDVFILAKEDKVYPEYGYFDPELQTTGFIDCLIEKPRELILIDYKLKHLDDEAYPRQLAIYERNLHRLYPNKPVKKYLLSILDAKLEEIL